MGIIMKGRTTLRKSMNSSLPSGDPMMPRRPRGQTIEPWTAETRPGTTLARLEAAYLESLADIDAAEDHRAQAKASGRYTDQGALADTLQFAVSKLAPRAHRRRQIVAAAKKELAERRAKLVVSIDKDDPYAFALRQKKLEYVLRLSQKEREATFYSETIDPDVGRAVIELGLPAEVIGIPASAFDLIKDRVLRAHHGDAIDELAQLEKAIAVAEPVVEAAQQEIAREAGVLDLAKFNELAAPHVKAATAPWLRQYQTYPPGGDNMRRCLG